MNNQQFIPLLDPATLEELTKELQGDTSKDEKYQAIVFQIEKAHKRAHCNVLTSIARLLSTQEVCGCFHLKEGELLLSTNRESRGGKFREKIGKCILQLVKSNFSDEAKLALYRTSYRDTIKARSKIHSVALTDIASWQHYVINTTNWNDISLETIKQLTLDLENHAAKNVHVDQTVMIGCMQVLLHLQDIEKICTELAKPEYKEIRASILKGEFFTRSDSPQGLHCELAAILRDSQNIGLRALMPEIDKKITTKEFTVSKPCCLVCASVFENLKTCFLEMVGSDSQYQEGKIQKLNSIKLLGNSRAIFPNLISLHVPKDAFSIAVARGIQEDMEQLINDLKQGHDKKSTVDFIENSEIHEMLHNYYEQSIHRTMSTLRL